MTGFGDQREPLGLKWAARWFDLGPSITSNFRVWRSSSDRRRATSRLLGADRDA